MEPEATEKREIYVSYKAFFIILSGLVSLQIAFFLTVLLEVVRNNRQDVREIVKQRTQVLETRIEAREKYYEKALQQVEEDMRIMTQKLFTVVDFPSNQENFEDSEPSGK